MFIQKTYPVIPDDYEQKQETLAGLHAILHEKKILQLRQYPTFHLWFLELVQESYSEKTHARIKQCLDNVEASRGGARV